MEGNVTNGEDYWNGVDTVRAGGSDSSGQPSDNHLVRGFLAE
jgi:hypothetical protein